MTEFTATEKQAIEEILSADIPGVEVLRMHFAHATVVSREFTGVGFYTKFAVPHTLPPMPDSLPLKQRLFAGAMATMPQRPGELILFMLWEDKERYLSCLEGYTTGEKWPENVVMIINKAANQQIHPIAGKPGS